MAKLQVMTLDNLKLYDELLKGYVDAADAKSLKTVAIDGNTLKFYRVEEPVGETTPAYEITLPETDISGLMAKLSGATVGNVVTVAENGEVTDGGVAVADLALKTEVEAVDAKADKNAEDIAALQTNKANASDVYTKGEVDGLIEESEYDDTKIKADIKANADAITAINNEESGILAQAKAYADGKDASIIEAKNAADAAQEGVDALEEKIGTVEEGKTVVEMIADAKTAATYDDTEVKELIAANTEAIEAHKTSIDGTVTTLVGEDTGKSVRTIANEELAAQLIGENAKESLDTLEEIAAWIQSHPDDASAMNKAIEDLETLVGTLPEGVTATTVVGYVQELVNAEKSRAEGVESGLNTRLETVEAAIGENGSVTAAIADAKKAGTDAGAAVTALADGQVATNKTNIEALQTLVGDGYEAIPEADIQALFTKEA